MSITLLKKGNLLIANPSINNDSVFQKSVLLITDYQHTGVVAFMINKASGFYTNDIFPNLPNNFIIYNGGPVEQENLYFIHTIPELIPNSIEIASGIYWAGDFDTVYSLLLENKIDSQQIRFFIGYTGWEEKQLQEETKDNNWIVSGKYDTTEIFNQNSEGKPFWKKKLKDVGGKHILWADAPANPNLN